jgi:hypothetical protein
MELDRIPYITLHKPQFCLFASFCHVLPCFARVRSCIRVEFPLMSGERLQYGWNPPVLCFRLMSQLFWHLKLPEVTWKYGDWLNHVKPNDAALGVLLCSFDMNHRVPGCTFPSCSVYHGIQPRVGHTSACALQRFQKWEADAAWLPWRLAYLVQFAVGNQWR